MVNFLETVFGWLINISSPLRLFDITGEGPTIDNVFCSMIKVFVMLPFLVTITLIPIVWIVRTFVWWCTVASDSIE